MNAVRPPISAHDTGGDGAPLLLVHGDFSLGGRFWGKLVRALTGHRRLITVERRGHGASPVDPSPYTFAGDAQDIIEAADRLGLERFHLVGHSYGGLVAIETARTHLRRVLGLHLIDPPYLALCGSDPVVARFREQTGEAYRIAQEEDVQRGTEAFFAAVLGSGKVAALKASPAWPALLAEGRRFAVGEFAGDYPASSIEELSGSIDRSVPPVPCFVYTGGATNPALWTVAHEIARRLPGCRQVEFQDAGHDLPRSGRAFEEALKEATA